MRALFYGIFSTVDETISAKTSIYIIPSTIVSYFSKIKTEKDLILKFTRLYYRSVTFSVHKKLSAFLAIVI